MIALGTILDTQGSVHESIDMLHQAHDLLIRLNLGSSTNAAQCLLALSMSYRENGQFDSATACANRSLAIYLKLYGKMHMWVASAYTRLADCLTAIGDYQPAIAYFREALAINDSLGLSESYAGLDLERHLARLYVQRGDFPAAVTLLESTLSRTKVRLGSTHLTVGLLYEDLADAHRGLRDYAVATKYYEAAIILRHQTHAGSDIAQLQWKLGLTYASRQLSDSALAMFDSSLASIGAASETNRLLRSRLLKNTGDCHVQQGKVSIGLEDYQRALAALTGATSISDIADCPMPPDVTRCPDYVRILSARATALEKAGLSPDSTSAMVLTTFEHITDALAQLRKYYSLEGSKFQLEGTYQEVYAEGLQTALQRYEATGDARYRDLAFRFAEGNRAAALGDALANQPVNTSDSVSSNLWHIRRELIAIQNSIEWHELSGDSLQVGALRHSLMTHLQEMDSLSQLRQGNDHKTMTLSHVRSLLGVKDCLVEYVVRDSELVTFVLRNDTSFILRRTLREPLDATVRKMLDALTTLDKKAYIDCANELSSMLITPLVHDIAGRTRIIIVPDGILNYLPFETLFSRPVRGEAVSYTSLPYLLRSYEVSYAPSSQVFARVAQREAEPLSRERSFVGFAPVFENGGSTPLLASRAADFRSVSIDGKTYQTLPHSRTEVTGIAELFRKKGYPGVSIVDREATKGRFEMLSANYGIVHIATHGFFNEEHPQFSGLIFAPGGDSAASEHDILQAGETYDLNVRGELVVLSSCQSGLGKMVTGEGIVGLTRGFLFSGARNVLYSLWDIRDRNTPQLMLAFYRHLLAGEPYAAALRSAKLSMLNDVRTATPLLWAGFVLAGP